MYRVPGNLFLNTTAVNHIIALEKKNTTVLYIRTGYELSSVC